MRPRARSQRLMIEVNCPPLRSVRAPVSTKNMGRMALLADSGCSSRYKVAVGIRIGIACTYSGHKQDPVFAGRNPNPMLSGLLKDFASWLGRIFLGERRWSIAVPVEKGQLRELVSSQIVPLRKGRLFFPLADFRQVTKVRGNIEGEAVLLLPPRLGVLGNLFGLNSLFQFAGRLTEGPTGAEISGKYQVVPLARGFMFVWLTGVMLCTALWLGLLVWFILVNDRERALVSLMAGGVGFGLLGSVYLIGKIIDWATKSSREGLHAFLIGLSSAKPDAKPDDLRAYTSGNNY